MSQIISLEEIYEPVAPDLREIPSVIFEILDTSNILAGDVIRYFFSSQGKLLRPALTLLGASVIQPKPKDKQLQRLAASYEIFHSATLIHDDIIDSAYLRRNLTTVHIKWNPQTAVLVGDFLHDKALGAIFEAGSREIFSHFLQTAGAVCDGEIHELKEKDNLVLSEEDYFQIIDKKTAVLLACALQAGALYAGASREQAESLWRFGDFFGMAFQIVDDCLDFTGNQHEFGKTLGADCTAGVLTLPLIRLLQTADGSRKKEIAAVFKSPAGPEKFKSLLQLIREAKTLEYSLEKAREFSDKAKHELAGFPESPAKQSLLKLLDFVLERQR